MTDLTDYYARRANEYERIYAKPERQTELNGLRLRLAELCAGRAVYEPEDIAPAIAFLASQQARYVNGHTMAVDGGYLASGMMQTAGLEV